MRNEQGVKNRIKELLRFNHVTENKLSKLGRLSQKVLNNQLSHAANLQVETVLFIMDQFPGVSANWIMTGEGTMYPTDETEQTTEHVDFSSMVNSIIAAKDETIDALNGKIASKEETISALKSHLEDMKKKEETSYQNDEDGYPTPFGVAEPGSHQYKR